MSLHVVVATLVLARVLGAQYAEGLQDWKAPPDEHPVQRQTSCSALRGLSGYEFTIITATIQTAAGAAQEFCRVAGQVQPEILFEVSLPAYWNRRLYMFGNGGYAGDDLEAGPRVAGRNEAIRLGFAVVQTNTGHDARTEPLGSFAANPQKLFDFGFRAVHVSAETAKRIAEMYYGSRPIRSYFQGCSTGGRQALISAQRFPQDFDGIIAGAPALDQVGYFLKRTSIVNALAKNPLPV